MNHRPHVTWMALACQCLLTALCTPVTPSRRVSVSPSAATSPLHRCESWWRCPPAQCTTIQHSLQYLMPSMPNSLVPCQLLCASLRSSWSPASAIRQMSSTVSSASSLQTRAFSVAGPTVWNSLPDHLRDPAVDSEQLRRDLKTYLFAGHSKCQRIRGVT